MTVGIGVLCEGGRAAVVAADRIQFHAHAGLFFEGSDKKIVPVAHSIAMLNAGGWPGADFVAKVKASLSERPTVRAAAEFVREELNRLREAHVEAEITRKLLGLSFADFKEVATHRSTAGIAEAMKRMADFSLDVYFLVAGTDDDGAHLFFIAPDKPIQDEYEPGFMAIGMGDKLALGTLASGGYVKELSLPEAVYRAYEAKRIAEKSLVGKQTDLAIITPDGGMTFRPDMLATLDKVFARMRPNALLPDEVEAIRLALSSETK